MKFNNSDNSNDFKRYEEYQRQKDINLAQGLWGLFSRYLLYFFIYMMTYVTLTYVIMFLFEINSGVSILISMALAFFIFKVRYVKTYPFKSFITVTFVLLLVQVAIS